jgi:thiol-disulfide isomerase/thioredoxin
MHYKKSLTILLILVAVSAEAIDRVNDQQIAKYTKQKGTVVLNFWATWCEPCVEEIPALMRLKKQFKNVELIGISLDEADEENEVAEFVKKQKMTYTIVLRNGENFETMVNSIRNGLAPCLRHSSLKMGNGYTQK